MSQKPIKETLAVSDNSLDLLRLFAALQIAITHYLNLSLLKYGIGSPGDQLLLGMKRILSLYPGLIILLTLSGFLMGESLSRAAGRKDFVLKRFRRIYPGLWVCMLLIAAQVYILLGPESISAAQMLRWGAVQGLGAAYTPEFLQGFATGSLNGTLWAIMVELQLYVLVLIFWKRILAWSRRAWHAGLAAAILLNLLCWTAEQRMLLPEGALKLLQRSFLPYLLWFYLGLYLWRFRDELLVRLSGKWLLLLVGYTICKACCMAFSLPLPGYYADLMTSILLPLTVLSCAYGWGRHRLQADLSYGIFLYHWPLINLIFFLELPMKVSHIPLFLCYGAGFLLMGTFSWNVVEKRVIRRKKFLTCG